MTTVNPFILNRKNHLLKEKFLTNNFRKYNNFGNLISHESKHLEELKLTILELLKKEKKENYSHSLLDLVRAIKKGNINKISFLMNENIDSLNNELKTNLKKYLQSQLKIDKLHTEIDRDYEERLFHSRFIMQQQLLDNTYLQRSLLMMNRTIYSKLYSYLITPINDHKKKQRKLEDTLYKFLTRAAFKTSPLGELTSVGRAQLPNKGEKTISDNNFKKEVALNFSFLYRITFFYLNNANQFITDMYYALPPMSFFEKNGVPYLEFVSLREDSNANKIYSASEGVIQFRINHNLKMLFEDKLNKSEWIHFEEIHKAISQNISKDKVVKIIQKYIELGLLTPAIDFDERSSERLINDIRIKTKKFLPDETYQELIYFLDTAEKLVKQLSEEETLEGKNTGIAEIVELLNNIETQTGLIFSALDIFYEDSYTPDEKIKNNFIEKQLNPLSNLQLFSIIFDTKIRTRCELGARLKKDNDNNLLEMDSDFSSELFDLSKTMIDYWADPTFINDKDIISEEVRILDSLKKDFINELNDYLKHRDSEEINIKKVLEKYQNKIPSNIKDRVSLNSSFFIQLAKGRLIVNNIYEGNERYHARFMNNYLEYLTKDENYQQFLEDHYNRNNFYEITDTFGFNGNVKIHRLKNECYMQGAGRRRFSKGEQDNLVKFEDFKVKLEHDTNMVKFVDKNDQESNICFRGSLTPMYMPSYVATIQHIFNSGEMFYKISDFVNQQIIPRLTYDQIILTRKRYRFDLFVSSLDEKSTEQDIEYFHKINIIFNKIDLPNQFFVVINKAIDTEDETWYNFKPFFVNLLDPISVKVFRKFLNNLRASDHTIFFLEEYLSNDDETAEEYNFEIYQDGEKV
ncbi:hypothetical protein [Lentibacillus sp. CBA3610]|uniref:hypothetical protein n=1 Tax=Lentibacillus sp. CBA3610 TaxID=2518176 RepID=UPI0015956956|nr:hypothetical protein [Lentibacillus sp. CBA3610]QKY71288.1 hypothetical protein Len3610_18575 [Lentibacillus sp. CBA3610]